MDSVGIFRGVHSPTVLLRTKCLQVISNAIAAVLVSDNSRDEVVRLLGHDNQVLDAVITLYASGHNYETVPAFGVQYRLTEQEWVALLCRAAIHSLSITLSGVIHE